jgi:hypothetical protein
LISLTVPAFAVLGATSGAQASAAAVTTTPCSSAALSEPFAAWGDTNSYELLPGSNFAGSLAGWTLSGGAKVVAGGEPFVVNGTAGTASLDLPAGASVQSPSTCVDAAYPTFRFFARNDTAKSTLLVQVVYDLPSVGVVVVPVGVVAASSAWAPTSAMPTGAALPSALEGGTAGVELRFTELTGTSQIDDVFIDPRCK